jgi:hypothetical protein
MHPYLGDFDGSQTVHLTLNTSDLGADPITLAGTPAFHVYRDDGNTEDASGITSSIDRDGRTGFHSVAVDLSADAAFYEDGHDYWVVITTGTVDGVSVVGKVLAQFSMRNRSAHAPMPNSVAAPGAIPNQEQALLGLTRRVLGATTVDGTEMTTFEENNTTESLKWTLTLVGPSQVSAFVRVAL